MLYNQAWDNSQDLFSLDRFIVWIETKPRRESYRYTSGHNCLIAQYLLAQGVGFVHVSRTHCVMAINGSICEQRLPHGWNAVAEAYYFFNTFGSALRRAKRLRRGLQEMELDHAV